MSRWVSTTPSVVLFFDTHEPELWNAYEPYPPPPGGDYHIERTGVLVAQQRILISLRGSFKISHKHPCTFYMGISPLPGSETSAFVSVLTHSSIAIKQKLNCTIKWFKKEPQFQNNGLDSSLTCSRSLASDTISSLNAWRSRVLSMSCTYSCILDVPRLYKVRLTSIFMWHAFLAISLQLVNYHLQHLQEKSQHCQEIYHPVTKAGCH